MSSVRDLKCGACSHTYGEHERTNSLRQPGRCLVDEMSDYVHECDCLTFAWEPYEEDPDQAWNDYKDGYTDIDGNVLEPSEPL
jgi:hypothetical protein